MVRGEAGSEVVGHKRWPTITVSVFFVLAAALLNLSHTPKTYALDILQPITTIINSLLAPVTPAPQAAPPAGSQAQPPQSQSPSVTPQAPTQPSSDIPPVTPSEQPTTSQSSDAAYAPVSSELEPVVLGAEVERVEASGEKVAATPPTSLMRSISQTGPQLPQVGKCGTLFGMCWYWWAPVVIAATSIIFFAVRVRKLAKDS